jgi:hypothetical protein
MIDAVFFYTQQWWNCLCAMKLFAWLIELNIFKLWKCDSLHLNVVNAIYKGNSFPPELKHPHTAVTNSLKVVSWQKHRKYPNDNNIASLTDYAKMFLKISKGVHSSCMYK